MPRMPLDPVLTPRIELCRSPDVYLLRDEESPCAACGDVHSLEEEGKDRVCIKCLLRQSGKDSILLFGWKVMLSGNQLIAKPPLHRMDGTKTD